MINKRLTFLFILIFVSISYIGCGGKKVKIDPTIKKYNEATIYLNNGNPEKAKVLLLQVIKKDPNFYLAYHSMGIIELYKRNFKKASQYFEKALKINPAYAESYNYLGIAYKEMGMNSKAEEMFKKVIDNPNYPTRENGFYNLALLKISEKKYKEALEYINHGLKINPSFAIGYNLRGQIYAILGENSKARKDYLKAVKIMPENPIFNFNLALFLYKKEKDPDAAITFFEKARALSRDKNMIDLCIKYLKEIDHIKNERNKQKKEKNN